jgi:hypothetical protein
MQQDYDRTPAQMEKEANKLLQTMFMSGMRQAGGLAGKALKTPFAKSVADKARSFAASPFGRGAKGVVDDAVTATKQRAGDAASAVTPYVKPVGTTIGQIGQGTTNAARSALDAGGDLFQNLKWRMTQKGMPSGTGAFGRNPIPAPTRLGPGGMGPAAPGFGARNIAAPDANPLSVRNLGIGAGTVAGGYEAGKGLLGGGASAGAAAANPAAAQAMNQTSTGGGGAGGFLSNMPKEMQYALAAGVPLALLGAYAGGRGNMMGGLGMGALGLGAAGLGAAGAGYFGDGARRFVGQGANSLMGLFGAGKDGDIMGQIKQLSRLSPEFGVTMLMGRNPGLSREEAQKMYEFLTQNQDSISKMMPAVTGAQTPVVKAGAVIGTILKIEKAARCWKGYEPVPGKKPYSNDSCRPTGNKKKEKKAAFPFAPAVRALHASQRPQAMTFDPNNANVKMLQQKYPQNWRQIMQQSQGIQNPSPAKAQPIQSRPGWTGGVIVPPERPATDFNNILLDGQSHRRPTMTQMPPKPPAAPVAPRDFSKMPKYVSEGQQWAEKAMQQMPASSMVKTQSVTEKEAFGGALLGAGARMAGKGLANFAMKGLPAMSRGLVQGAGKATSMVGNAAQAGGRMMGAAGQRVGSLGEHVMSHAGQTAVGTARNPLERFTADAVGTLGGMSGMAGNAMQGIGAGMGAAGRGVNMAGRGLQQAGQYTAAALPLSAAGAYGAYQAARPMMPNVQFRNPIADMGGVDVRPMRFQNPVQVGSPPPAPAGARHTARR